METSHFLMEMQKIQSEENESLIRKVELVRELAECEASIKKNEEKRVTLKESLRIIKSSSADFVKRRNDLLNRFNGSNLNEIEKISIPSVETTVTPASSPSTCVTPAPTHTTDVTAKESDSPGKLIIDLAVDGDQSVEVLSTTLTGDESVDTHSQEPKKTLATPQVQPSTTKSTRSVTIESGTISVTRNGSGQNDQQPESQLVIDAAPTEPEKLTKKLFVPELERATQRLISEEPKMSKKRFNESGDSGKFFKRVRSRGHSKSKSNYSDFDRINIEISLPVSGQNQGINGSDESVYQSTSGESSNRSICQSSYSYAGRPFSDDVDIVRPNFESTESNLRKAIHLRDPRIPRNDSKAYGVVAQNYLNERLRVSDTDKFSFRSICYLKLIHDYLYVACKDGTVKRYNINDYADTINYLGHKDAAKTFEVELKHSLLLTGSESGLFRYYKLHSGVQIGYRNLKTQIQCIVEGWDKIFVACKNGNVIAFKFHNDLLTKTDGQFRTRDKIITLSPIMFNDYKLMIVLLMSSKPLIVDTNGNTIITLNESQLCYFPAYIETNQRYCVTITGCSPEPLDMIRSVINVYNPYQNWSTESRQKEPGVITATCLHKDYLYAAILIHGVTRVHCYRMPDLLVMWIAYHNQERVFGLTVYSSFIMIGSESGEITTFTPDMEGPFYCVNNLCSCSLPFARPADLDFHVSRYCR